MVMADAPRHDPTGSDATDGPAVAEEPTAAPPLSWAEQETIDTLKRLARAQSQVQALKEQLAAAGPPVEAADGARLAEVHAEVLAARSKAAGRFGRAAAQQRLDQLEMSERLLLERIGLADYDAFVARSTPTFSSPAAVDLQVLAFARHELASARLAWLDVQTMPEPRPDTSEPELEPDDSMPSVDGPDVA
jgi:hypothetical protein